MCDINLANYAALQTETGFWFHRLQGESFQKAVFTRGPQDIVIDRDQIQSKRLEMFSEWERNARKPQGVFYGRIRLYTADQELHEFYFGKHPAQELCYFFGLTDEEIKLPERKLEYGESLKRQETQRNRHLLLYLLCFALDLAVYTTGFLLPYVPWLVLALAATVLPAALAVLFPAWYTFTQSLDGSREVYGKKMLPVHFLLFLPLFPMLLRLPEVTYLPGARVLICALPAALLSVAVWFLSPERKVSRTLGLLLTVWTLFGCSAGLDVNAVDYYCNPPDRIEVVRVIALDCPAEPAGAQCHVTAETAGGELRLHASRDFCEALSEGDSVTVFYYDGTMGIPFARLREDTGWQRAAQEGTDDDHH